MTIEKKELDFSKELFSASGKRVYWRKDYIKKHANNYNDNYYDTYHATGHIFVLSTEGEDSGGWYYNSYGEIFPEHIYSAEPDIHQIYDYDPSLITIDTNIVTDFGVF